MEDTLNVPFVRKIFNRISKKTSFKDINNYLKSMEEFRKIDPIIKQKLLIPSCFDYFPCSGMIFPITEDKGLFWGLEKRGEGPIYGDFSYKLENGVPYKHITPIFLENWDIPGHLNRRFRQLIGQSDEANPFEFKYMREAIYLREEVRLAEGYIPKLQKSSQILEERIPLFRLCKQAFDNLFDINIHSDNPVDVDSEYRRFRQQIEEDPEKGTLLQRLSIA